MIIEIRNTDVVYLTTSTGKTIYIDDSTNELIIDAWDRDGQPIEPMIIFTPDFNIQDVQTEPHLHVVEKDKDDEE